MNKGQFRLSSVPDCCSNGQCEYFTLNSNLFFFQAEKRKTDNLCVQNWQFEAYLVNMTTIIFYSKYSYESLHIWLNNHKENILFILQIIKGHYKFYCLG